MRVLSRCRVEVEADHKKSILSKKYTILVGTFRGGLNCNQVNEDNDSMSGKGGPEEEEDSHVQMWKVKQLIRKLSAARGNGTSMISLIIPPGDQISRVQKMLGDEFGTASNIKSRVTRQSVLSAITSTQQKLKIYTRVPPNGLVVYCGMIITGKPYQRPLFLPVVVACDMMHNPSSLIASTRRLSSSCKWL